VQLIWKHQNLPQKIMQPIRRLPFCVDRFFTRSYAVKTALNIFKELDIKSHKIQKIAEENIDAGFSLSNVQWERPNPVRISIAQCAIGENGADCYCGGLPALMQAAHQLERQAENSKQPVAYIYDGQTQKTSQSGHQAHEHPSEWSTEDCSTSNLIKAMLRGLRILPRPDPLDLENYTYIDFPFSYAEFLKHPVETSGLYAKFFAQRIVHNLTDKKGVSKHDRWLCQAVRESLDFHQSLSRKIESQGGEPTFLRKGRVYWSPFDEKMRNKKRIWDELGIDCSFMEKSQLTKLTLLKEDHNLQGLYIKRDGRFFIDTPSRILHYLEKKYANFTAYKSSLQELCLDQKDRRPIAVKMFRADEGKTHTLAIRSFFGSLGHNQVFFDHSSKPLWVEVPVSGISTMWKCTVDKEQLENRLGNTVTEKELQNILPVANLSNLHVTILDARIAENSVIFFVRGTQGAHFNSLVANKNDLRNMWENLNRFFIGDWELLSVGTCSRKTDISNVPEVVELSLDPKYPATIVQGLSGIGYSISGASRETWMKRREIPIAF